MFGLSMKMYRAVTRRGKHVEFVNGVGGMVGEPYKYRCTTVAAAQAFEAYCAQRDPINPDMPVAVGEEIAATFGAVGPYSKRPQPSEPQLLAVGRSRFGCPLSRGRT